MLAGSLEHASEHPVAKAIAQAARAELGSLDHVSQFESLPGLGTTGVVSARRVIVGGEALFSKANQNIGDKVQSHIVVAFRRHVFWFFVTSGRSIIELIVLR